MREIIIREAEPRDAEWIADLEQEAFGPMAWSKQSLLHDIEENERAVVMVADVTGDTGTKHAGYADAWSIAGEAQLNNIAVFKQARGMHAGQMLMEKLIELLTEAGDAELSLEVRPSNEPAIALYRKLGFTDEGLRPGYYEDNGEDALIMRKLFYMDGKDCENA